MSDTWQRSNMERVTFGIVSFNRPAKLSRLLESIERFYPGASVAIAENGLTGWWNETLETRDGNRRVLLLPFDAGCSAARNCLIDRCETEYLLFLEEDFVFTQETDLQPLIEILDSDSRIGMAGGLVKPGGIPVAQELRTTSSGVAYCTAKGLRMFAIGRREFFADHRFDELLKTGEHGPFMTRVERAGKWELAFCDAASIEHHKVDNTEEYAQFRQRAAEFRDKWKRHLLLEEYLTLKKDRTTRSLFGRRAFHAFGHGDLLFLDFVLSRHKWKNCVELGTGSGLTTLYLAVAFGLRKGEVTTYDIRRKPLGTFHEYFPDNVTFTELDVLTEPSEKIISELSRPNTFAFFDNGKKRQEVAMYAKNLKPGSGFIVHDWPKEFGPEDVPAVLEAGFGLYGEHKSRLFQSCCRCFVRKSQ